MTTFSSWIFLVLVVFQNQYPLAQCQFGGLKDLGNLLGGGGSPKDIGKNLGSLAGGLMGGTPGKLIGSALGDMAGDAYGELGDIAGNLLGGGKGIDLGDLSGSLGLPDLGLGLGGGKGSSSGKPSSSEGSSSSSGGKPSSSGGSSSSSGGGTSSSGGSSSSSGAKPSSSGGSSPSSGGRPSSSGGSSPSSGGRPSSSGGSPSSSGGHSSSTSGGGSSSTAAAGGRKRKIIKKGKKKVTRRLSFQSQFNSQSVRARGAGGNTGRKVKIVRKNSGIQPRSFERAKDNQLIQKRWNTANQQTAAQSVGLQSVGLAPRMTQMRMNTADATLIRVTPQPQSGKTPPPSRFHSTRFQASSRRGSDSGKKSTGSNNAAGLNLGLKNALAPNSNASAQRNNAAKG